MNAGQFDTRQYETLSPREGYARWAPTYEQTVPDELDIRLLERLSTVDWTNVRSAIDLACGTGRSGAWLRAQGVQTIDGVDLTPEMLDHARTRRVYRTLIEGSVERTNLETAAYDLALMSLADEHLEQLAPLYREAARLTTPSGRFVIVGYHPHFLMQGVTTHFHRPGEAPTAIRSYVHLFSDHFRDATAAGWRLRESHEGVVDERWLERKPKWERFLRHPVSFAFVWEKAAG